MSEVEFVKSKRDWGSGDIFELRPSYKYDTSMCKRVSVAARDVVLTISHNMGNFQNRNGNPEKSPQAPIF